MRLHDLLDDAKLEGPDPLEDVEISAIAHDSRKVGRGTLFVCVVGESHDGHEHAASAVESGAVALVTERELDLGVPEVVVEDSRAVMPRLAAGFWRRPGREIPVIAVTGTNGKTTTAWLLREILADNLGSCGLIGTVRRVIGGEERPVTHTTPEAIELQGDLRAMVEAGDRAAVFEASSHALELRRCDELDLAAAVFTNLTQDHLDFHGDMETYFASKRRLFEIAPESGVVNIDDPYGRRLAEELDAITFSASGSPEADLRATEVAFDAEGSSFRLVVGPRMRGVDPEGDGMRVSTLLPGDFNVANSLAAIGAAWRAGVKPGDALKSLARAGRVPGRLEPVELGQEFAVLVDYAHTPDSLENVLIAARRLTPGRLIVVFGAGGDRDRDKRPMMGAVAARLSDLAFATSDNPRSEPPDRIVEEVISGCEGGNAEVTREVDRRKAIALALESAAPGDTVVIAGKGHEQGQELKGGRKIPFDDRVVAHELLSEAGFATPGTEAPGSG